MLRLGKFDRGLAAGGIVVLRGRDRNVGSSTQDFDCKQEEVVLILRGEFDVESEWRLSGLALLRTVFHRLAQLLNCCRRVKNWPGRLVRYYRITKWGLAVILYMGDFCPGAVVVAVGPPEVQRHTKWGNRPVGRLRLLIY